MNAKITNSYESRILNVLRQKTHGSTITEIANELKASRNTVSKYIKRLEKMGRVESKRIGVYKLYYSYGDGIMSKITFINFYKGLVCGLKLQFPNQEEKIKEIGKYIADFYALPIVNVNKLKDEKPSIQSILILLEEFNTYNELFNENSSLAGIEIIEPMKKFLLKLSNFSFFRDSTEFIYHGYLVVGYMERLLTKKFEKKVKCDIKEISISEKKPQDSYVEVILEFKNEIIL
ncbi:MAG: ArsR family transcriptional regulator [Promethearchaeota archaeon]|nr:MAG: ArsR family transcriptional regulator [Candidatus Lokiarchaeota archaeon]